ncbi:hypothetical protein ACFV1L_21055 [Kitasatospora sp. NPDC059646]|uniref:hypothetical protein n=1 Tax=Kitasatospora sp. NPDC059646 TaxID=3346893 RepID=UPI0036897211
MPARVRTKRRSALPPIRLSALRPSTYNLRCGEVRTIVCPDCQTWQRIMGDTTLTIRDHVSTDLSGAELTAGQQDRRCTSARRIVEVDLTADEIARWQRVQDRRISPDAMPAESRRGTTVLKKTRTPLQPAVLHIAQGRPAPSEVPAPTAAERTAKWAERYPVAETVDMVRRATSHALHADTRRRLYGPDLQVEERDTREASRALAERRTEAAIRQASPLRRYAAA